jgi:branched-chain amino acid transport system ATP-binding protein
MSVHNILETANLTKKFDGLMAVDNVDFQIAEHERVGIIGPNGAGKTTFFNLLTGLFPATNGYIHHYGDEKTDISNVPPHKRVKLGLIRTFQLVSVFNSLKVIDNLVLSNIRFSDYFKHKRRFFLKNTNDPDIVQKCINALKIMGIENKARLNTNELSYGDKRKLEIAIAISLNPKVLLLDEPLSGLGDVEIDEVINLIRNIGDRFALIIIEHKISRIVDLVDRLCVMNEGQIIADGSPKEVLCDALVREVYWGKEEVLECYSS